MTWERGNTITVSEIIDIFPRLGVPHFQRGRVWRPDAIASLLESLFHDTPCGSFVFWNSGNNAAYGVPLDELMPEPLNYLIIDGQQRIRSLHDAFTDAMLDTDEAPDDQPATGDPRGPKQWCVNLAKVPGFDGLLKPRARNFPLFVYTANPRTASARSPLRDNVLPLSEIHKAQSWEGLGSYHGLLAFRPGTSTKEGLEQAGEIYPDLRKRILEIREREFFVAVRERTSGLAQMADLYNRINTGGKQVETEERAFATLVGLQSGNTSISDGLRGVFSRVHPDRQITTRDALLKREEERAFGFKLFIRVFLQVCQHHLGYRQGKSTFSFDLVARDDFREAITKLSEGNVAWLWEETCRVVDHVRSAVLCEELKCDDLRMLPDATGLMPVLQLLIQYPDLGKDAYRPLLAALCLRLALADFSPRELLRLVARAGDPTHLAFDVVPELLEEVNSEALTKLVLGLDEANSIQDRYVLLLYWLERHLGAHDFRYDKVANPRSKLNPPELSLNRKAGPEKQHLVPFANASRIFGEEVRRTEWHPFNNVGNLTYISGQLNGLDALGDDFADMVGEREQAQQNLSAHLLWDVGHEDALKNYEWIRNHIERREEEPGIGTDSQPTSQRLERKFRGLTKARRQLIHAGFQKWLAGLDSQACVALQVGTLSDLGQLAKTVLRVEPVPPRFPIESHPVHFLRGLGLGNDAEDRLLVVLRKARRTHVDLSTLRLQITKRKHVWVDANKNGVTFAVAGRLDGPLRIGVFDAIGWPDSGQSAVHLDPVPDFSKLLDYCAENDGEIAKAIQEFKKLDQRGGDHPRPEIGDLEYPRSVAERLSALGGKAKESPRQGATLSLRFQQERPGRGVRQAMRIDLYREGKKLDIRLERDLGKRLTKRFPELESRVSKGKFGFTLEDEATMLSVLDWVAGELKRHPDDTSLRSN